MVARVSTVAFQGVETLKIDVQVQAVSNRQSSILIVGLPDKTVEESRERLRSVFTHYGLSMPPKGIVVNLSPADVPKEGSHYDLPIALAILAEMGVVDRDALADYMAMGELALDGQLVATVGALPAGIAAMEHQVALICPEKSGQEASWSSHDRVIAGKDLMVVIGHLQGKELIAPVVRKDINILAKKEFSDGRKIPDWDIIRGQDNAKRAMEVAAVGGHHVLLLGSPGAGKSLIAQAMAGILPDMTARERLEASLIHSLAGTLPEGGIMVERPYRDPHHSASMPAVIGGGQKAKPGEISLAHSGVLFLDEMPEFHRSTLESLRQPLETGRAVIARVNAHVSYSADFQMVAAMNPCKCGYLLDDKLKCSRAPRCGEEYRDRLSGPLLDRIDIYLEMEAIKPQELVDKNIGENTVTIKKRVEQAVRFSRSRFKKFGFSDKVKCNADLEGDDLERAAPLDEECKKLLTDSANKFHLSARAWFRTIRVARTIADMGGSEDIKNHHLSESLKYRFRRRAQG
ncbi:MAG: YifB family Mg chelatase-like AAA ATPase [Alphaproteobacteria bacterium]